MKILPSGLSASSATRSQLVSGQQQRDLVQPQSQLSDGVELSGGSITGKVLEYKVDSPQVGERKVWVYLPPGYKDDPANPRSVLYVMDGGSAFDTRSSVKTYAFAGQEFGLDESIERLSQQGAINAPIVVALESSSDNLERAQLLSPSHDARHGGGGAKGTLDFLVGQLKPWVDGHFSTRADAQSTGIMGASLGGLFALHAATNSPAFGLVGALSPSLWFADQAFLKAPSSHTPSRAWIDTGDLEAGSSRFSQDPLGELAAVGELLEHKGMRPGENLTVKVVEGGKHHMSTWQTQIDELLTTLYPPKEA